MAFLLLRPPASAQWRQDGWDVSGGISLQLGTVIRRAGIVFRTHYFYNQVQGSFEGRMHYNFAAYGPPKSAPEVQLKTGILYAFGKDNPSDVLFKDVGINQTNRANTVSYTFNAYLDKIGTSQTTGTIGLQFGKFVMLVENDILGKPGSDEYRTGSFLLAWQDSSWRIGLHSAMWTGNPHTQKTRYYEESTFARFGYKDISEGPYGKFSNGVLALSAEYSPYAGQVARLQVGADAEQIRNAIQNRLMHDMYFWPEKWNTAKNRHLPMLDTQGEPYLYLPYQKIRPTKFFSEIGFNPTLFY